jgi:hypothetical protein
MELDGVRLPTGQTHVPLADDGLSHELRVTLGQGADPVIATTIVAPTIVAPPLDIMLPAASATAVPAVKEAAGRIPS